jgi:hypothetical protein
MYDPTLIDLIAHQVLNCVCARLDEVAAEIDDQPGCPCRLAVVAGIPPIFLCEVACIEPERQGQLYVSVPRIFRTSNFPIADQTDTTCKPASWAMEILITLMRCAALPDAQGNPPTTDRQSEVATIQHIDMCSIQAAVLCCMTYDPVRGKKRRVAVVDQRAKGPEGTSVGSETRIIVDLNDACGCPEEPS